MATEITTTDWDATGVLKQGSYQALTVSKQRTKVYNVTIGMCDSYPTAGVTLDLSDGGRIGTVTFVTVSQMSLPNLVPSYFESACAVASTGKVKFFESVAGGCAVALTELTCCSCAINCLTFKVHVIGKA